MLVVREQRKGGHPVKIDVGLRSHDLHALGGEAAAYERLGADGLWSYETAHDPFLPLFAAALTTERVSLGTGIAVAFARTPFAMTTSAASGRSGRHSRTAPGRLMRAGSTASR
jgi:alkanesulfonate monooxygenase SsuD/methylene tetrahydromethanopterin reductase-like flavin-dependent oxidoreductase (luciferase family)